MMSSRSPKYNEEIYQKIQDNRSLQQIVYNHSGEDSMVLGLKRLNLSQVEKDMVFMGSQNISPAALSVVNRSGIKQTTQLFPPDSEKSQFDGETLGHTPQIDRGHKAVHFDSKQAESKQMISGKSKKHSDKLNGKISQRHMPVMSPIAIDGGKSPMIGKNKIKFLAPIDTATPVAVKNLNFAPSNFIDQHKQSLADISPISASQPKTPVNQKKVLQKFLKNSGASNAVYQSVVNNSESRTAQKQLRRFELTPVQTKNLSSSIGGRSSSLKIQLAPINASSGAATMMADYHNASHASMPHNRPQKPQMAVAGKFGRLKNSSLDLNAQSNDYITQGLNKKSGSNVAANPISLILNHQQISDPLALIKLNKQNNQIRNQVQQRMRGDSQHVMMGSPVKVQDSSPQAAKSQVSKTPKFQSSYQIGSFTSQLSGIQEVPQNELTSHQNGNIIKHETSIDEREQNAIQYVQNEMNQDNTEELQRHKKVMKGRHDITLPTIKKSVNNSQDNAQEQLQFQSENTQSIKNNQYDKRSQNLATPSPSMNANFSGSRNNQVKHQSHMPVPNKDGEFYHQQYYQLQQDNLGYEQTSSFAQQSPSDFYLINQSASDSQSNRINRNKPSSKTVVDESKQIGQQYLLQDEESRFRAAKYSQANNNDKNSDSVAVRHIVASQNKLYKKNFSDHQQLIKDGNGNLIRDNIQGSSFDKKTAEHTNRASSALQNRQQQFENQKFHQQVGINNKQNVEQIRDSQETIKQLKISKKHNHQNSPATPLVLTKDNINFSNKAKLFMAKSEETQVPLGSSVLLKSQVENNQVGTKQQNNSNNPLLQNSTEQEKSKKSGADQQASEQYVYLSDKQIFVRVMSDQNEQSSTTPSSLQKSQQQPHIIQTRNLTKVKNGKVEVHEIFKRKKEGVNLYNAAASNSLVDADNLAPMYVMKEHHPRRIKQQQQMNPAQIRGNKHRLQSQNNHSSNSVTPSPQQIFTRKQAAQQNQIVLNLNRKMSKFGAGQHYNSSESIGSYHKSQSGNGQENEHALETLRIMVRGKDSAGAQSIDDSVETLDKERNIIGTASAAEDINSGGEEDGSTFQALTLNKKQPHSTRMTIGNKDLQHDLQEDKSGMSLYLIDPKLGDHKPVEVPMDVLSLGPPPASGLDIVSSGGNGDHNNNSFQGGIQYITKQDGSLVMAKMKSEEEQKEIPLPKKIREKMSYLNLNKITMNNGDTYSDNESSKASKRGVGKKKKQDNKKKMKQTRDDLNPWSDQKNERIESDDEEDNLENAVQQHKMASSCNSQAASEMLSHYQDEKITVSRLRSEFLSTISKAAGSQTLLKNSNSRSGSGLSDTKSQRSTKQKKNMSAISLSKKVSVPLILHQNEADDIEQELVIQGDDDQDDSNQDSSCSNIEKGFQNWVLE